MAAMTALVAVSESVFASGGYVAGDFHQHTTYSDGSYSFGVMMD